MLWLQICTRVTLPQFLTTLFEATCKRIQSFHCHIVFHLRRLFLEAETLVECTVYKDAYRKGHENPLTKDGVFFIYGFGPIFLPMCQDSFFGCLLLTRLSWCVVQLNKKSPCIFYGEALWTHQISALSFSCPL